MHVTAKIAGARVLQKNKVERRRAETSRDEQRRAERSREEQRGAERSREEQNHRTYLLVAQGKSP
jgi:hypothetical protein